MNIFIINYILNNHFLKEMSENNEMMFYSCSFTFEKLELFFLKTLSIVAIVSSLVHPVAAGASRDHHENMKTR